MHKSNGVFVWKRQQNFAIAVVDFSSAKLSYCFLQILVYSAQNLCYNLLEQSQIFAKSGCKMIEIKNITISAVFGFQLLLLALCTVVLSVLGYWLFVGVANNVLADSLQVLATNSVVLNAQFLTFIPVIAIINCVLILFLSAISFAFPMLKIRKINPVQIIKSREE